MSLTKWIFGALGFALHGPIGAVVGVLIGSLFDGGSRPTISGNGRNYDDGTHTYTDNSRTYTGTGRTRATATPGDIRVSLLVLIACVMKADGKTVRSELDYVKQFLLRNYGEEGALEALKMLRELLKKDIDHVAVAQQIGQNVNYSTRLEIVHMLLELANADGNVSTEELTMTEQIALCMGLSQADYDSLSALYRKTQDANWAYTALEITPDATDDEVKKAYRRMALKYHPDKVAGAGEEMVQQATKKFRSINEAYEAIKSQRGMK